MSNNKDIFKSWKAVNFFNSKLLDSISKVIEKDDNVVISPLSIYIVLSIALIGSSKKTRDEILNALNYLKKEIEEKRVHKDNSRMLKNLLKIDEIKLNFINGLFFAENISEHYLSKVKEFYKDTKLQKVDFPNEAIAVINKFVKTHSNGLIEKIVDNTKVNESTELTIVNTLYFKASWENGFDKENTKKMDFYVFGNEKKNIHKVDMMYLKGKKFNYEKHIIQKEKLEFNSISLPFSDNCLTYYMVLLITEDNTRDSFEKLGKYISSEEGTIDMIMDEQGSTKINNLYLPKFTVEREFDMIPVLKNIGIKQAFSKDSADFSKMTKEEKSSLFINNFTHKTKLIVDEDGCEGSSTTSASFIGKGISLASPVDFSVDHPFYCFIVNEEKTGTLNSSVLFYAKIIKPVFK
jgi:serpin B